MKTLQTRNSIALSNGDFFDYDSPETHNYDIEVIAHSLANLCRYGGHSRKFYSVAEHSVFVSLLVPRRLGLCALLHDASEAYCGDVCKPLKNMLPDYERIENRVQQSIAQFFGLPYPYPEEIHRADKMMYKAERVQITDGSDKIWHTDVPEAEITVFGLPPAKAKKFFLDRYHELQRYESLRRQGEAGYPETEPLSPRLKAA